MSEREVCTITICLSHDYNRELGFELEDAVKESWNKMIPWFTRRHNITNGTIDLRAAQFASLGNTKGLMRNDRRSIYPRLLPQRADQRSGDGGHLPRVARGRGRIERH